MFTFCVSFLESVSCRASAVCNFSRVELSCSPHTSQVAAQEVKAALEAHGELAEALATCMEVVGSPFVAQI